LPYTPETIIDCIRPNPKKGMTDMTKRKSWCPIAIGWYPSIGKTSLYNKVKKKKKTKKEIYTVNGGRPVTKAAGEILCQESIINSDGVLLSSDSQFY
jgi:hypothetical protein